MNYSQFNSRTHNNPTKLILEQLGILEEKVFFFKIDTFPDFDLTEYQKGDLANYIFQNSWDFSDDYNMIVEFDFNESAIYHADNITAIAEECGLEMSFESNDFTEILTRAYKINPETVEQNNFPSDYEFFNLKELRVTGIDNISKEVNYQGSIWADDTTLDPIDFQLINHASLVGIKKDLEFKDFYLQLLCESYILMQEQRYKLAFFTAYSSLENFTNAIMNSHEIADRFEDKLKEVFKTSNPVLNTSQIYTSIIGELGNYTSKRNTIAHGRKAINIGRAEVEEILRFASILIALYTWKDSDFDSLFTRLIANEK